MKMKRTWLMVAIVMVTMITFGTEIGRGQGGWHYEKTSLDDFTNNITITFQSDTSDTIFFGNISIFMYAPYWHNSQWPCGLGDTVSVDDTLPSIWNPIADSDYAQDADITIHVNGSLISLNADTVILSGGQKLYEFITPLPMCQSDDSNTEFYKISITRRSIQNTGTLEIASGDQGTGPVAIGERITSSGGSGSFGPFLVDLSAAAIQETVTQDYPTSAVSLKQNVVATAFIQIVSNYFVLNTTAPNQEIHVYDMLGRNVYSDRIAFGNSEIAIPPTIQRGVYIVSVGDERSRQYIKFVR